MIEKKTTIYWDNAYSTIVIKSQKYIRNLQINVNVNARWTFNNRPVMLKTFAKQCSALVHRIAEVQGHPYSTYGYEEHEDSHRKDIEPGFFSFRLHTGRSPCQGLPSSLLSFFVSSECFHHFIIAVVCVVKMDFSLPRSPPRTFAFDRTSHFSCKGTLNHRKMNFQ